MYTDPTGHKYVRKEVAPGFFSDVYEAEYEYVRKEVVPGMYANVYEEKYVMPVESSPESIYTPLPETSINYDWHMEFNTISIFDIYESATGRKISWDVGWNRITTWFSELPENLENAKDNPKETALGIGNSVFSSGSQIVNYFNSGFWAMNGNQQMADHSYRSFNSNASKAQTYVVENHVKNAKAFEFGTQAGDVVQMLWGLKDLTKAFKSVKNVPFTPTKSLVDAGTGIPFKPSWLDDAVKQKSNIHQIKGKAGVGNGAKPKTLIHYTNEQGMNGIVESKQLKPSLKANNPKDARYGDGQYLSDIDPSTQTPSQLAKKFINVPNKYKYTNYVEIDVTDLEVVQGRDGVFVILNDKPLDLTGRIVSTGKVGK